MIWLIFALLTGLAVMSVLAPLALRREAKDPAATDVAFFGEQIAEIERERDEGRLDPQEAETARTEAARRLLRAQAALGGALTSSRKAALIAALGTLVLIPAVAIPLYLQIGKANLPDMPLAGRLEASPERADLSAAVTRIEAHLVEHPDDGRGWEVLAPYYMRAGRVDDAIRAYGEAVRLLEPSAARHAALGEARVFGGRGVVSKEAREDFESALKLDANLPVARYYVGLFASQAGEKDKAIDIWTKLLADAPPRAPWAEAVRGQLDKLKGVEENPADSEQGKAIASMPQNDQQAMIRTMVERLAGKLEKNGGDVEGWLKLIRAYAVLGEADKAKKALTDARKALETQKSEVERVEALARDLNIGG